VATSRINDPFLAEKLSRKAYRYGGMVRAQIADPEFGNKAAKAVPRISACVSPATRLLESEAEATCLQNAAVYKEARNTP